MTPRELLDKIGITQPGYWEGDAYIVDIETDSDWGKVNSKLDSGVAKEILLDQDNGGVEEEGAVLFYTDADDAYLLTLTADFDSDTYRLMVEENPS